MIPGNSPHSLHPSFLGLDYDGTTRAYIVEIVDPSGYQRLTEESLGVVGQLGGHIQTHVAALDMLGQPLALFLGRPVAETVVGVHKGRITGPGDILPTGHGLDIHRIAVGSHEKKVVAPG